MAVHDSALKRKTWIAVAVVGVVVLATVAYVLIDIDGAHEGRSPDAAIDTPRPAVPEAVSARRRLRPRAPRRRTRRNRGADWLDESDLVLRAAAVIDNGRDGNIPTRPLGIARVLGAF